MRWEKYTGERSNIFTLDGYLSLASTSYLKNIACNLFFLPPLPEGSILSTFSKLAARRLVPLRGSVFGIPLNGVQRKFASLRKLPELSGNAPFCWMQTCRNPQTSLYTPEITRELLAFFFSFMNCSQQKLWIWCIAVYFYTSSSGGSGGGSGSSSSSHSPA